MSSVTLGMIVKNEEEYLSRTLPIVAKSFDEIIAIDAESSDRTREILKNNGAKIHIRAWTNDWAEARNAVIERTKTEWLFMLDADEAMFRHHVERIKSIMSGKATFVVLPRVEFVGDSGHYDPSVYPDWQGRIFRTGCGYRYRNKVHEVLFRENDEREAVLMGYATYAKDCPIYHYGQCKDPSIIWLRHHNYGLIKNGKEPLTEVPGDLQITKREGTALFQGRHPLERSP